MGLRDWLGLRRADGSEPDVTEAVEPERRLPSRSGFEFGVGPMGLDEHTQGIGSGVGTDRRSLLNQLYDAYLACPWSWACAQVIARTITAGGLVAGWDRDAGEGNEAAPEKPPELVACEQMLAYCNPSEDIRQILRGVVTDLLVFGDAYLEVVWLAGYPVALYSLDCPSMMPLADDHGVVTGYVQLTELGQRATFEPHEVIHIALDSPRSGVFGVSPTQALMLPITSWLFTAATVKEIFRKGNPPNLHADFPAGMRTADVERWVAQYAVRNIGPRNIGRPVVTIGGASVNELQQGKISEYLAALDQRRDEIVAGYGVPPRKVGVMEPGSLGGAGVEEGQDRTFHINTCQPLAETVLEKINYALLRRGFGVTGWRLRFDEVDWRDSKVVEDIRDQRLRNGSWSLNRYRAVIGEPPVDGGDDPVLVERQIVIRWSDVPALSAATVGSPGAGPAPSAPQPPRESAQVRRELSETWRAWRARAWEEVHRG